MYQDKYRCLFLFILFVFAANIYLVNCQDPRCKHPGISCDCSKDVINCIQTGNNTYEEVKVDECQEYYHCWEDADPPCKKTISDVCAYKDEPIFECTADGMYPDPLNCDSYFICVRDDNNNGFKAHRQQCRTGKSYNSKTKFCDNPVCERPIECVSISGERPYEPNPNMYYICRDMKPTTNDHDFYYPIIFKCPSGEIFADGKCRP